MSSELEKPSQELSKQDQKIALDQTAILQKAFDKQAKLEEERKKRERKRDESRIKILLLGTKHLASWIVYYMRTNASFIIVDRLDPEYIFTNPEVKKQVPRRLVEGYQFSELDMEKGLAAILQNNKIDFVINTLSVHDEGFSTNNPNYTSYYNNTFTQQIMNALVDNREYNQNIKFIHISTDKVYGDTGVPAGLQRVMQADQKGGQVEVEGYWKEFRIDEKEQPNPMGVKAISRYTQEIIVTQMCKTHKIDYLILRIGNLWGRYTPPGNFLNAMMIDALRTKTVHIYGDQFASRHLLNIEDFAEFLRDLLSVNYDTSNWNDIYNIGGDLPTRYYIWGYAQFIKTVLSGGAARGIDPKAAYVLPWGSIKIANDPPRFYEDSEEAAIRIWMDTSKSVKKLKYTGPRDIRWDESFKELLLWNAHYHVGYSSDQVESVREKITYTIK
jgi:nucleoside-diphosphate-sugar epimerase